MILALNAIDPFHSVSENDSFMQNFNWRHLWAIWGFQVQMIGNFW